MKTKIILLAFFLGLSTMGPSCINEGFLISVNLPIEHCYSINSGPILTFNQSTNIEVRTLLDESYRAHIAGARFYDIQVKTTGTFAGSVAGEAYINNILLFRYGSGPTASLPALWSAFATPQSLLGTSPLIQPNPAGVAELLRVLNLLTNPANNVVIALRTSGAISGATTVPAGLGLCVEILAQADANVNNN